jgi:cytochrome c biogenesis protein CcdA/thiol-disulfide isomerase/thioredoxin
MTLFVISYLAGVLTIASPCILPIIPFVLSRADRPFARGVLPMLAGMVATFAVVATLAAVGGGWAAHANDIGRAFAITLLAVFGLTLVSSGAAAILTRPIVVLGNRLSQEAEAGKLSLGGSLLLGVATGLLWAPCAGPVLGLVLTGAALQGVNARTTLLLTVYAGGAATSMALAVLAGGRMFAMMKRSLGAGERIRQVVGVAVLVGVAVIALGLDTGLLARLSYARTSGVEQYLLDRLRIDVAAAPATRVQGNSTALTARDTPRINHSSLPVEGTFQSLGGAVTWLNSVPLSVEQLRGKVVLVDFWTYSCINCIRTIPYVRAWAEKYKDQGLVVIGVHTPEFAFEKKLDNVQQAIRNFGITYPLAIDNDYKVWRSFQNEYWPALYFIDAKGLIRHHQFGEGDYDQSEQTIQDLLSEASGEKTMDGGLVSPHARGAEAAPDLLQLQSEETYLGYEKTSGFVSAEGVSADHARDYRAGQLQLNQWSLAGNWTIEADQATLNQAGGAITYRFRARDLHFVLGPGPDHQPVRFQVTVDGNAPEADHGADIDAAGNGKVDETRLYQLVRQSGEVRERTFEVRFLDPGVAAYVFTFG